MRVFKDVSKLQGKDGVFSAHLTAYLSSFLQGQGMELSAGLKPPENKMLLSECTGGTHEKKGGLKRETNY